MGFADVMFHLLVTAAVDVLKFWPSSQNIPLAAYITLFLFITALPNIFPVRWYGHVEFAMSWAKLIAVVIMIFYLFIMVIIDLAGSWWPLLTCNRRVEVYQRHTVHLYSRTGRTQAPSTTE